MGVGIAKMSRQFVAVTTILLVSLILVSPSFGQVTPDKGVAVYPFGAKGGASPAVAEGLTALFINEIANVDGVRVVAEDIIEDLARQLGLEQACGTASCQIDLAKQVQAEYLVRGDLTQVGQSYFLTALVIKIESNETVFSEKIEATEVELVEQTGVLADKVAGFFASGAQSQQRTIIDLDAKLREARRRQAREQSSPVALIWGEYGKVSDINKSSAVSPNDKLAAWRFLSQLYPAQNRFRDTALQWMTYWRNPDNRSKEVLEAKALFERACAQENHDACTRLGEMIEGEDAASARARYEASCKAGDLNGCYRLGMFMHEREANPSGARDVWMEACKGDEARACNGVGFILETVEGNWKDAGKFYKRACEFGDLRACSSLGYLYETRMENWKSAKELYEKACEGDVMSACYSEGLILENQENNWRSAKLRYQKACEGGVPSACDAMELGSSPW